MTVWCGQCQTKNDGDVDRCVRCGAPLRPELGRPIRLRASSAIALQRGRAAPRVERYDPRWLQRLIEEQCPEYHELRALVGRCRTVVRVEGIEEGDGQRIYFLPERSNSYVSAPEDVYTLRSSGWTVEIVTVKDQASATRRAVYYIQTKATLSAAPIEVRLAQYKQLCGDRRALQRLFFFLPLLVALIDILIVSFTGALPGLRAADSSALTAIALLPQQIALFCAAALNVYVAILTRRIALLLSDQHRAVADLEVANELVPTNGSGYCAPGRFTPLGVGGWLAPSSGLLGLMVSTSMIMLWLLVRAIVLVSTDISRWEPVLVMVIALAIYPCGVLLRNWWQRHALRGAQSELLRGIQTGAKCRFEPWLELPY